ncbi:leucyl aminopeptidase [Rhodobaculum claviforme]|uniref:Probable cytosol aminopeptidase n=1 Tax=Rhodobaculum claviforme TaxID=1549854 RepID=A0A934WE89_9RHOB|nr:leucyl aminopeptidase [Rhodobaculum claviforme]MBK5926040.1 leucyl aminopeptidase [Rhodobaculum claviforme]
MTRPPKLAITEADAAAVADHAGVVAVLAEPGARLDPAAAKVDRAMRGALARAVASEAFAKLDPGAALRLQWPGGLAAEVVLAIRLDRKADAQAARRAGATLGAAMGKAGAILLAGAHRGAAQMALGAVLRAYAYTAQRSKPADPPGEIRVMVTRPDAVQEEVAPLMALAEGVYFTRDLVNSPANVLTTRTFSKQIKGLKDLGLEVEILDEDELEKLGMGALLAVGQGSSSPTRVAVMQWKGGKKSAAPLALVGKGVVFDSGGISLKPGAGMEDMTMDMAGAGVVAGVMKTLALRKAKANVVGLVGLVENMPSGTAMRPGDVIRSMKGDTIEVINTDAEGRLVLADVMWYAQERFKPAAMVDLATLTGAIIIALGHENTGVFSNDDALAEAVMTSAAAEGEGAWRMPLAPAYDKLIKSRLADMKNTGGRAAGSVTAAQFLARFVKDETPWVHLDIAGTALRAEATAMAPRGATGWGVCALDRLVRDRFEG